MPVPPAENNIQMAGVGIVGKSTSGAGMSSRLDASTVRTLLSVRSASEEDSANTAAIAAALASYYTAVQTDSAISVAVAALVDSSPGALDTLNELAAALGDDPDFATTVSAAIGAKYTLPGTGVPLADLSTSVQASLALADSALQSLPSHNHTLSEITDAGTAAAAATGDFATAAQGAKADTALQPAAIASGTITARTGDVNLSGGTTGDVLTVQADGSLSLETPVGGGGGSPGGSSGQLQYNNAGAFGGTVAVVYAGSGSHVTVTAQAATDVGLVVKGAASQTANMFEVRDSADVLHWRMRVDANRLHGRYAFMETYTHTGTISGAAVTFGPVFRVLTISTSVVIAEKPIAFTSNLQGTSHTLDVGIARDSAGVLRVTNGSSGRGSLLASKLNLSDLPTSDPAVAGDLWNDGGTLKISAG